MTRLSSFITLGFLAVGCADDAGPRLLLPNDVEVTWEQAYDREDDGLGALVPVDVMAYDPASGEPLGDVELLLWAEDGVAWPVAGDDVAVVDPDSCPDCELMWDATRDQFLDVVPVAESIALRTDGDGLARLYVFVDTFPAGSAPRSPFAPLPVVVVSGSEEQSFLLLPR